MPKLPMTPDDIDALSKAWNESKSATDVVLAKFREGASKDEIDDAIPKITRLGSAAITYQLLPITDH